jgi:DNA-binding CsgD family transcriptional regulator
MLVVGDDGVFLDANASACHKLGRARADIVGQLVNAFSPPDRRSDVRALWARFLRDRHVEFMAPVVVRGNLLSIPAVMAADADGPGRHVVAYLDGAAQDADGLGVPAQPLELLARSTTPAMVFDNKLIYRFVNEAAATRIFERPAEEIVGLYAGAFTPLDRQTGATPLIADFRSQGQMLLEWEVVTPGGTRKCVTTAVTANLVGPGRHLCVCLLEQRAAPGVRPLSPREREITQLLSEGLTGEEIARELVLSPETVRTHVRNAMSRVGAKTRSHLVALAVREQLLML